MTTRRVTDPGVTAERAPSIGRGGLLPSALAGMSRTSLAVAGLLPLVLIALWGLWLVVGRPAPVARIGAPAPEFALADLDGQPLTLADLRGRPVIVNFWASWCGPCVEEFPLLERAQAEHASQGLVVVGMVYRDRSVDARAFMERMGAYWPAGIDPGERVAISYGVYAPPASFFIDRNGVVAGRQIGQLTQADLDRQLGAILEPD